jgi:hypothetical protein
LLYRGDLRSAVIFPLDSLQPRRKRHSIQPYTLASSVFESPEPPRGPAPNLSKFACAEYVTLACDPLNESIELQAIVQGPDRAMRGPSTVDKTPRRNKRLRLIAGSLMISELGLAWPGWSDFRPFFKLVTLAWLGWKCFCLVRP